MELTLASRPPLARVEPQAQADHDEPRGLFDRIFDAFAAWMLDVDAPVEDGDDDDPRELVRWRDE